MSESPKATSPSKHDGGLPDPHPRPGPPSIISSRMTDIASEDGEPESPSRRTQRRSLVTSESRSRPGTARTAASSRHHPQPLRKTHLAGLAHRGSVGSGTGSVGRTPSRKSRSHVPSLTSNAFYAPVLSSQKLQAQRGGPRPLAPAARVEEAGAPAGLSTPGPMSDDGSFNAPPSRGTDGSGQDTVDRRTANTSPTQGYAHGSIADSVRPLQKPKPEDDDNRGYTSRAHMPGVLRPSRSFGSSFLMRERERDQPDPSRRLDPAEKLSSGASTPHPSSRQGPARTKADPPRVSAVGRVFEYFEGNTVFCLGGRWQNARQRPVNVATGLFVVVPAVLFFAFSAPELWREVSPAVPIVFAYLAYICFSSFIHASVSDPGVRPPPLPFPTYPCRTKLTSRRSSRVTSTSSRQPTTTTPSAWGPRRQTGTSCARRTRPRLRWRCPSSTAARATSGGRRARTTAASVTTASRRTTTTAYG